MEEETIDKIFRELIRNEMNEKEFWGWVASWKDADNLCEQAEDWDSNTKLETLKEYPKLVEKIKRQLVIDEL